MVVGALAAHEAARASAVLSGLALVSAVVLGLAAFRASTVQLRQARIATYLAHRPVLAPVHEASGARIAASNAVRPGGTMDPWFPAQTQYQMGPPLPGSQRVFRVSAPAGQPDAPRATVFIRNVGQGPAFVTSLRIASLTGVLGIVAGRVPIGAGGCEEFVVELVATDFPRPEPPLVLQGVDPARLFILDLTYVDVFETPREYELSAWFDPRDSGVWRGSA